VTSPGGTTQAAIELMESKEMGEILVAAIRRAAERSRELGT
jgi:pyrroline-5-carboxylate reductase